MKSSRIIHNLSRVAHKNHIPRHKFLASLHPKERPEGASFFDELEPLNKLPNLQGDREIIHHKLTMNTRVVSTISSRDVEPDDLMLLAGLLPSKGGTITVQNGDGQRNLPDSGVLIDLEICQPAKNRASFEFRCGEYGLTRSSWAGDPSATTDAWESLEKLWLDLGDICPGAVDAVSDQLMPEPPRSPWTSTILLPPLSGQPLFIVEFISRMTSALGVLFQHNNAR